MPPLAPVRQIANVAVCSVLLFNNRKGTTHIYVHHQHLFHKAQTIIGERFVAKIINFGSLVLHTNLDQDYPSGTTVRAITPHDARGVGGQDIQSTHGVPNSQRITDQIGQKMHPIYCLKTQM